MSADIDPGPASLAALEARIAEVAARSDALASHAREELSAALAA